jgi:hypothetical protein
MRRGPSTGVACELLPDRAPASKTPEFSCWSPTLCDPPDFHKPRSFGRLVRAVEGHEHERALEAMPEMTVKAVVTGVLLGIVFGAANAYVGLRVGLTVSASIPAAVMTVAVFRLLRRPGTILEANLSQTIGSASTSLTTGTIFTIPALFL